MLKKVQTRPTLVLDFEAHEYRGIMHTKACKLIVTLIALSSYKLGAARTVLISDLKFPRSYNSRQLIRTAVHCAYLVKWRFGTKQVLVRYLFIGAYL